ncbi:DUF262 domain-containing protein [Helicobacter bilis]|uniref:DUF262 domain-containing protein n=1 Tax=Helicobacter bilis TaxID=37372 RepID=UPI0009848481|nr:DUF262 domain-containing protein [Helicobacter bilis]
MNTQSMTFKDLAEEYKYTIKIPRIQRDYAQGRKNAQKIREKFVRDLFEVLKGNDDKTLHLQFVYGSVKNNNEFIPLDGQQRLTTLYLLHWYIAMRNNTTESYLANFTHETRSSSKEFCKALSENTITIKNSTDISATIKDQAWFLPFWEQDPTIQSMLTMLDSIHTQAIKSSPDTPMLECFYKNLDKLTFSFIKLEDFGLDDELYIKMNARGELLNDFENFKAAFEDFVGKKFKDVKDKDNKPIPEAIAYKFDNEWLESVFNYVKEKEKDDMECIELAQSHMLNIIKYLCEMLYYKANENEKSSFDWDKVHFSQTESNNDEAKSSQGKIKDSTQTQNIHSMYKIFETQEELEILIYVFDNFDKIKDKAADIFTNFTTKIGNKVGDKVCIFDTKNENGTKLFAAMVQGICYARKANTPSSENDNGFTKQYAIYLFSLICLMKKQDETKIDKLTDRLREVRNYCNYMGQKYLSNGVLFYTSAIHNNMGEHIKECIAICNKDIVAKDEIIKQFEDHQYFKGDLELLFGKVKASGKKPLDKDDKAMLENAKIILNKEQTHSIIANLIYHRFNRNFWLGETYNKTKFLVGGKEAWHIMLTRNWKNKISGELATAFRAMCKEKLIRDDELLKKCKKKRINPQKWQYYFIKYSKSFFKDNHNSFIWNKSLEIYRLTDIKRTPPLINPFLWTLKEKIKEKLKLKAEYKGVASIKAKDHCVKIKGKCEIQCANNSFVITPLSDECRKSLEQSLKQQPSLQFEKGIFTISLTNDKDIIEALITILQAIFTKENP